MNNTPIGRLRSLKSELEQIQARPWVNVRAWIAKATPIIRNDWPGFFGDFKNAVRTPQWTALPGVSGNEDFNKRARAMEESENEAKAESSKQRILSFLEGLEAVAASPQGNIASEAVAPLVQVVQLAERKLRKAVRTRPSGEREIQDVFENLLIGADILYKREKEKIEYSSKTYIPDFTFPQFNLALDLKFCGTEDAERRLIREINDYILAFQTRYSNVAFVVYDLGFIRNVELFTESFERNQDVRVCVVKH